MDEKLEAIWDAIIRIEEKLDKHIADLSEFSERFEEVVLQMEAERRLDWQNDFN